MATELVLRLEDLQSPGRWSWVLCDPKGAVLARHAVALDASDEEHGGFIDLPGWLDGLAAPDDRRASMARLTERVGAWMGEHVLGPIGPAIVEQGTPAVVRVQVPFEASSLLHRPLDLAHVGGMPLAHHGVSLFFEVRALAGARKRCPGENVRMLAVFAALPDTEAPVGLRRLRHALIRLVEDVRRNRSRSLELTVLDGGVTRERLRMALEDEEGWDVLHIAGQGLAGGLLLEPGPPGEPLSQRRGPAADPTSPGEPLSQRRGPAADPASPGEPLSQRRGPAADPASPGEPLSPAALKDLVVIDDLARMLRPAKDRIKLVVLSSCDPAGAIDEAKRWLGIPDPAGGAAPAEAPRRAVAEKLSTVAERVVREIGCAALTMRYPVGDDFGIELCLSLYWLLFDRGVTLTEAVSAALRDIQRDGARSDLAPFAPFAPVLVGPLAPAPAPTLASITLLAPKALLRSEPRTPDRAHLPAAPDYFVGRTGPMARAAAALAPQSPHRALLLHGMAGAGKTTCAAELVHGFASDSFRRIVWHKAPDEGADITGALAGFAARLEAQIPGVDLVPAIDDEASLGLALPRLTRLLGLHAILVVLDNLESLLTAVGAFRDPRWGALLSAMIGHTGRSRLILTSRIAPTDLASDARVRVEPLRGLDLRESLLLARERPNLGALLRGGAPGDPGSIAADDASAPRDPAEGRALLRRVLAAAQGHPKLLDLAERLARTPSALRALLDARGSSGDGEEFFEQGETAQSADSFAQAVRRWTRWLTAELPEEGRMLLHLLCCLEEADRTNEIVEASWARLGTRLGWSVPASGVSVPNTSALIETGLVSASSGEDGGVVFHVDSGVIEAGRAEAGETFAAAVDEELGNVWVMVCKHALGDEDGRPSRQIIEAGRRGTPYLMRRERWKDASRLLQTMLVDAPDPALVSEALPRLRRIAEATRGTPWGLAVAGVLAHAVLRSAGVSAEPGVEDATPIISSRLPEAERLLREVLDAALAAGDSELASGAAGSLTSLLRASGRAEEALQVIGQEGASAPPKQAEILPQPVGDATKS